MRLFVWREGILPCYTDGVAIALADDIEQARVLIVGAVCDKEVDDYKQWRDTPDRDSTDIPDRIVHGDLWRALELEPDIFDGPTAILESGSA